MPRSSHFRDPFILAVAAISLLCVGAATRFARLRPATVSQNVPQSQEIRFELLGEGRSFPRGAINGDFQNYKSTDGVYLQATVQEYRSAAQARNEMQRRVKTAVKIIERGPKRTEGAQQKDERIVLLSRHSRASEVQAVILWNDGAKLHTLESSSLKHILAFEKQVYEAKKTAEHRVNPKL